MDAQELLTTPASALTRKQRKDRAALKRRLEAQMRIPRGYMLGRATLPVQRPGTEVTFSPPGPIGQAIE